MLSCLLVPKDRCFMLSQSVFSFAVCFGLPLTESVIVEFSSCSPTRFPVNGIVKLLPQWSHHATFSQNKGFLLTWADLLLFISLSSQPYNQHILLLDPVVLLDVNTSFSVSVSYLEHILLETI